MRYDVMVTEGAARDIKEIHDYVAEVDSRAAADSVLTRLVAAAASLATTPKRGSHPPEPAGLGFGEYRRPFFKPYRIIYRVIGKQIFIYLIVDGRRDMRTLLARRLLSS